MSFGDIVWFIIIGYALVAYLMVLFAIIGDLFKDPEVSGLVKAIWILFLILLPLLTAFVYIMTRGREMTRRAAEGAAAQPEYDLLKEKALT